MKIKDLLAVLILVATLGVPTSLVEAKQYKAGVAVSTVKKGGKVTQAQLNANPTYKEAVGYFQKKNYAAAMKDFQVLDSTGYCSDMVHYYIAQCYQNTNQTVAAGQHYDWVLGKSKNPTLRRYAEYANQCIAYYSGHRTYGGQGNNFDRGSRGGSVGGGGGGGGRVSLG
ncbi:MAG: hypothetical protein HYX67_04860 [Candidatus Melainabacteria bacterium]|nr:hypothetical protein [Candidatus Melainabacteria bacterium]